MINMRLTRFHLIPIGIVGVILTGISAWVIYCVYENNRQEKAARCVLGAGGMLARAWDSQRVSKFRFPSQTSQVIGVDFGQSNREHFFSVAGDFSAIGEFVAKQHGATLEYRATFLRDMYQATVLPEGNVESHKTFGIETDKEVFSCLSSFKGLEFLSLKNLNFTDENFPAVDGLGRLEVLDLEGTKVSDEGIMALRRLRKLKTLNVKGTAVTEHGVRKLKMELPNCDIILDSP